ncbi:MAG TPA: type II secretion system protein [Candidatus Omnitrophota bacterium]|nr:type II secretion system protein [Candidatus Omnitrophota bacterium]HPT07952.1 type II secretion system protein [Candidatus Omnitrophota bacterium]
MKNSRGHSFVTLMIVIAVFALSLRIAIEQVMMVTISQNESSAAATLKLISTALENFAKDTTGRYPATIDALTKGTPIYLEKDYLLLSPIKGYMFTCPRLETSGYMCTAIPLKCRVTGKNMFTITTGGSLSSDDCSKKE